MQLSKLFVQKEVINNTKEVNIEQILVLIVKFMEFLITDNQLAYSFVSFMLSFNKLMS